MSFIFVILCCILLKITTYLQFFCFTIACCWQQLYIKLYHKNQETWYILKSSLFFKFKNIFLSFLNGITYFHALPIFFFSEHTEIQPMLLECNFVPCMTRALEDDPELINDIFGAFFIDPPPERMIRIWSLMYTFLLILFYLMWNTFNLLFH